MRSYPGRDKNENSLRLLSMLLFFEDPGLPVDVMGEGWIGYEAMNIKEIRSLS
jgi:DNA-binding transcriptional regulator PaaX